MSQNINKAKPQFLYRGIVIPYDKLESFSLSEIDLVVPYEPIIDENGDKVVLDGNEYGVYMTDNKKMVQDVYGNIHGNGTTIQSDIKIGSDQRKISIPSIGISYEIDTKGIDVRQPKITSTLRGHYNNGFQGDEWIADKIPSSNYEVFRIRIGEDILHKAEDVPIIDKNIEEAKKIAIEKMKMRKYRLDSLVNELSKMTPIQRLQIEYSQISILKDIFGPDGVRYINSNDMDISNNFGKIKYLFSTFYNKGNGVINYTTLDYIESLKQKLAKSESPEQFEMLNQIILEDIKNNDDKRNAFIQRKNEEGVEFTTAGFDRKSEMMNEILNSLILVNEKSKKTQGSTDPDIANGDRPRISKSIIEEKIDALKKVKLDVEEFQSQTVQQQNGINSENKEEQDCSISM
ncbi:MAG: hypothetical protein ACM3O4_05645 [Ignavibacteriales bacterium]